MMKNKSRNELIVSSWKGEDCMNRPLVFFFIFSLLSSSGVWAQDGNNRHSRGDGGWGNGGPGFGNNNGGVHPKLRGKRKSPSSPKNFNKGTNNVGKPGQTTPHQFNHNFGTNPRGGVQNHAGGKVVQPHGFTGRNQRISPKLQKMGISHLPQPLARTRLLNTDPKHSTFKRPGTDPDGHPLQASVIEPRGANAVVVQNHMNTFIHNTTFTAQINVYNRNETVANHYYWHTWGGYNYCHYYDPWGYHWYGWYWGGHCFWSRWYGNNWWWYDPVSFRWCYWYNGWWWWQDPYQVNVVYVYNNGQYEPSTSTQAAPGSPAGQTIPASQDGQAVGPSTSYASKDGTRMVKVVGGDAFLYDTTEGETDNKPYYLGSDVKEVRFSNGQNGKPFQILLVFDDGSFQMLDSDGNPPDGGSKPSGD